MAEFKASLVYRASSRTARTTQRNPVLKNLKQTNIRVQIPVPDTDFPSFSYAPRSSIAGSQG